jgi:hypothetical protein
LKNIYRLEPETAKLDTITGGWHKRSLFNALAILRRPEFWLLFLIPLSTMGNASDGALASIYPRIPEPMVFDLVRPLGAQKGELEINTLAEYEFESRSVEWAPEIEYAFVDLYAFELELPMENGAVDAYKFALQGTFKNHRNRQRRFIHGWQYIGEYIIDDKRFENNLLYLFGYKFNARWSTLNMVGFRHTDPSAKGDFEGLLNSNLFYSIPGGIVLGVEINWEHRPNRPNQALIVPQAHMRLGKHTDLQIGGGLKQIANRYFPHLAMRLIYAF